MTDPIYLSRLVLNARHRLVQTDLADCQALHRRVMSGFPDVTAPQARAALGVLYRLDPGLPGGGPILLVQSRTIPDWSRLPAGYLSEGEETGGNPACKRVDGAFAAIAAGDLLVFRLLANPTKRLALAHGEGRRLGPRVEHRGEEAQLAWLRRRAEQAGFTVGPVRTAPGVPNVLVVPGGKVRGRRGAGGPLTLAAVRFDGLLRVTEPDRFRQALAEGIGPGKAYGFGLLSVARPRG